MLDSKGRFFIFPSRLKFKTSLLGNSTVCFLFGFFFFLSRMTPLKKLSLQINTHYGSLAKKGSLSSSAALKSPTPALPPMSRGEV